MGGDTQGNTESTEGRSDPFAEFESLPPPLFERIKKCQNAKSATET